MILHNQLGQCATSTQVLILYRVIASALGFICQFKRLAHEVETFAQESHIISLCLQSSQGIVRSILVFDGLVVGDDH